MKRILPGLALAACWLLLLLSGSFFLFWSVVYIVAFLGASEYLKMVLPEDAGNSEHTLLTIILSLPVLLVGIWHESGISGGLFLSFFSIIIYTLTCYSRLADPLALLSRLSLGAVYVGFLVAHLILIWTLPEGNYWLIILVAITAGSDSGAYYTGKNFGRRKLCESVSPNKTVEGALGGIACGLVVAIVFSFLLLGAVKWLVIVPIAIVLTVVGIIGDLCESVIKRGTNTKDSGRILLGHGGILDRVDSMILAAPLLYYLHVFTGS